MKWRRRTAANLVPAVNDYSALFECNGDGPWLGYSPTGWLDSHKNDQLTSEPLPVVQPDPKSDSPVDRLFFRVPMSHWFFGQEHKLDMFAARAEAGLARGRTDVADVAQYGYSTQLSRLLAAQSEGHEGSQQSLAVLHNVAAMGGKIALMYVHGGYVGGEWHLFSEEQSVPANAAISDIASRTDENGQPEYQAIYVTACNRYGASPDTQGLRMPVIANLAVNGIAAHGNAQVFLPDSAQP